MFSGVGTAGRQASASGRGAFASFTSGRKQKTTELGESLLPLNPVMRAGFLDDIAPKYDERIKSVFYTRQIQPCGRVERRGNEIYIWLHPDRPCLHKIMFTFFHEIAHVVLGHVDRFPCLSSNGQKRADEKKADKWALMKMGILHKRTKTVKKAHRVCAECLVGPDPAICPKEKP